MAASQSQEPVTTTGTLLGNYNLPVVASRDNRPEFELFQHLPLEARRMIWHEAMVMELPHRLVPLVSHEAAPVIVPHRGLISPILAVNKESRQEAQRFFNLKISVHRHVPLNPEGEWDTPHAMRLAATGKRNGTLRLSPECVLFARGGRGIHTGTEFGDEYKLFHFHYLAGSTPRACPSIAIPSLGTIAQIRRLAVLQESSHGDLHILQGPGSQTLFRGRIDEALGRGPNFWPFWPFFGVREHFTIFAGLACYFVDMMFNNTPKHLYQSLDIRRWSFIESHEEEPGRPFFFVSKKVSDALPLQWTTDEPEDFDYYDVRDERRLWNEQPHWRYFGRDE
ncbi:hypothetical protein LQW54_006418 [Pestalotiopsis sp. IQ-011]